MDELPRNAGYVIAAYLIAIAVYVGNTIRLVRRAAGGGDAGRRRGR
ncbi:MAG TPA: hypothetical protein VF037_10125 [Gemmatimonadales bacterium]